MNEVVVVSFAALFAFVSGVARAGDGAVRAEEKPVSANAEIVSIDGLKNICKRDKRESDRQDPCMLNLWGLSHHPNTKHKFNERNWGAGLRYNAAWNLFGEHWYAQINWFKNSVNGGTLTTGVGVEYPIVKMWDTKLFLGGEVSYIQYEHPLRRKTITGFLPTPTLSLAFPNGVRVNSMTVLSRDPNHRVQVIGFNVSFPFDAFFNRTK